MFLFLLFSFFFLSEIKAQSEGEMQKAIGCMSITQKKMIESGQQDPKVFSPMILNCFISISDKQISELMQEIQATRGDVNVEKYSQLLDYSQLYSKFSQDELIKKSEALSKAIENFRKMGGLGGVPEGGEEMGHDSNNYRGGNNLISMFVNSIGFIFSITGSFGEQIIMLLALFIGLHAIANLYRYGNKTKETEKKAI